MSNSKGDEANLASSQASAMTRDFEKTMRVREKLSKKDSAEERKARYDAERKRLTWGIEMATDQLAALEAAYRRESSK